MGVWEYGSVDNLKINELWPKLIFSDMQSNGQKTCPGLFVALMEFWYIVRLGLLSSKL